MCYQYQKRNGVERTAALEHFQRFGYWPALMRRKHRRCLKCDRLTVLEHELCAVCQGRPQNQHQAKIVQPGRTSTKAKLIRRRQRAKYRHQ
jgi:RNA polymerase subunit RPABC4/transcription elongation factor Spt4